MIYLKSFKSIQPPGEFMKPSFTRLRLIMKDFEWVLDFVQEKQHNVVLIKQIKYIHTHTRKLLKPHLYKRGVQNTGKNVKKTHQG